MLSTAEVTSASQSSPPVSPCCYIAHTILPQLCISLHCREVQNSRCGFCPQRMSFSCIAMPSRLYLQMHWDTKIKWRFLKLLLHPKISSWKISSTNYLNALRLNLCDPCSRSEMAAVKSDRKPVGSMRCPALEL